MSDDVTHAMLAARSKRETLTKAEAGYTEHAPTFCQICEYFKLPVRCTLLKTSVDPIHGCCDLWHQK